MTYSFINVESRRINKKISDQIHTSYRGKVTVCQLCYDNWPCCKNSNYSKSDLDVVVQ